MPKTRVRYHPLLAASIQTALSHLWASEKLKTWNASPLHDDFNSSYNPGSHWLFWTIPYLPEPWKDGRMRIGWMARQALHDPCKLCKHTYPVTTTVSKSHHGHTKKKWEKKYAKDAQLWFMSFYTHSSQQEKINHPLIRYLENRVNTNVQIKSYCQRDSSGINFQEKLPFSLHPAQLQAINPSYNSTDFCCAWWRILHQRCLHRSVRAYTSIAEDSQL